MNKIINLNIACGDNFITENEWVNLDYESNNLNVIKCDVLKKIPFTENSVSSIYTSHFIEHIPLNKIDKFLQDCFRVLKYGGIIRIVTPDFVEMTRSYINAIDNNNPIEFEYIKIEILDQLIRKKEGGNLRSTFKKIIKEDNQEMKNLIKKRLGYNLEDNRLQNFRKEKKNYLKIIKKIFINNYIRFIITLLPAAFRSQNVNLSKVGENHKWIWDYFDLKKRLEINGFSNIKLMNYDDSDIKNFPYELDVENNLPRKGIQSFYVEATK